MLSRAYQWYVIYTKPRHELSVHRFLELSGIRSFCPVEKVMVQRSDRRKLIEKPVFSMYVFVYVSLREYLDILQYHSVIDFVRVRGVPSRVPEVEMAGLIQLFSRKRIPEVSSQVFLGGQSISIKSGPFTGFKGKVIDIRGKRRVQVRLSCIDCSLLIDAADLELVNIL
jgi:transcription antitermination factor NusG